MYLTRRFYTLAIAITAAYAMSYLLAPLYAAGTALLCLLVLATLADMCLLCLNGGITAERTMAHRFSNGDDNEVCLHLTSRYPWRTAVSVIDETPFVFQRRDILFKARIDAGASCRIAYRLRPTRRGVYQFGKIRVFATSPMGIVERRFTYGSPCDVKVYPSYLALHRYELLAHSDKLTAIGVKRMRKAGNNTEFEHIKEYVAGDSYRSINWKASAHRHQFMVNVYEDERSQQIVSVIDKGRAMQQAFCGMTLLDYAINASLMLSYVAIRKDDKAGLITFSERGGAFVAPSKRHGQMERLLDTLYAEETRFGESDFSILVDTVTQRLAKRSLLVLYTSFADKQAMYRQLPYLIQLNHRHRLLVVFFTDNELRDYLQRPCRTTEDYYRHVIIERMLHSQRNIVSLLRQHGILSLLTTPQDLSVDVVNKYLEIKAREKI